jgi:hypothetical protein
MYYSITYFEQDLNEDVTRVSDDSQLLIDWALERFPNLTLDQLQERIKISDTAPKYKSTVQKNLWYWAEAIPPSFGLGNVQSYCVVCQVEGFAASEGYDDWFGFFSDANEVAYRLAQGESLTAEY